MASRIAGVRRAGAWVGVFSLIVAGCSGGVAKPTTVAVSGTVMYKNAPVEGARVAFWNEKAPKAAEGITDANGKFTLSMFEFNDGAIPGENVVTVTKAEPGKVAAPASADPPDPLDLAKMAESGQMGTDTGPKALLPAKYATQTTSDLKVTVTEAGPNQFPLQLTD